MELDLKILQDLVNNSARNFKYEDEKLQNIMFQVYLIQKKSYIHDKY